MKGSAATGYRRARASFPLFVRPEMTFALLQKSYTHSKVAILYRQTRGYDRGYFRIDRISNVPLRYIYKRRLISSDLLRSYLRSSYIVAVFLFFYVGRTG